jgi:hypothetical protein
MENNLDNFDDLFRKRMSDFEPQGAKPDWGAFEQRWAEKEEAETADFDRIIREKLRNVDDSSRRAQHWKRMEARLDSEFTLRGKLMRYRVLEAAAVVLLIWTVSNSLDYQNDNELLSPNAKTSHKVIAQQEKTNKEVTSRAISGTLIAPSVRRQAQSEVQKYAQNKPQLNSSIFTKHTNSLIFDNTFTSSNTIIEAAHQVAQSSPNKVADTKNSLLDAQNTNENHAEVGQNLVFAEGTEGVVANVTTHETTIVEPLAPKVKGFDLHLNREDMMRKTPIVKPLYQKTEKPSSVRAIMYASATLDNTRNTVNSPVFYGESFDIQANGGGGINIAFNVDKNLEVETGLAYASKKYTPVQVRKITGNFDRYVTTSIRNVQLNLVNLPVHLKYRFKRGKRWNFFGVFGGSLNVAAQTSYDTELALSTPSQERRILIQTDGDRLPQDYKNGLLEGGKFQENYFLTADIGVGAEYKLNKRWSLFAQPIYMQQIGVKGIGPNKDRINTVALHFGSKVTL